MTVLVVVMEIKTKTLLVYKKMICRKSILYARHHSLSLSYVWGITVQLKCAFDRLFAIAELNPNYENPQKECILLMASEGITSDNFTPVKAFYEGLISHLGWKNLGIVYAGGNMNIGDILNKPEQLKQAEDLGKSI